MSAELNLDKLNSIGPGVDLTKVPQINKKRLLTFINHFIITTVSFLNKFSQTCESRLLEFDLKMQKLEAELCLLEAKLNSIPGLEVEEATLTEPLTTEISAPQAPNVPSQELPVDEIDIPITDDTTQETPQAPATPVERNPELAKYFKMRDVGVPVPAVKLKMKVDGFDPDLLDS